MDRNKEVINKDCTAGPAEPPCGPDTDTDTTFFHSAVHGDPLGPLSFKPFADKVPKTAGNFRALSTGKKGFGYKDSCFLRIIGVVCARVVASQAINGCADKSVYGEKSDDENFILKHMGSGICAGQIVCDYPLPNVAPDKNLSASLKALKEKEKALH
ncbi:hypothetical protein GH733_013897 [Mirounga leonina]|nr:hypothetical protein GH733_013897 [Mirounga leonina]